MRHSALIRDVQFHPVTDAPEHVDFQRLAPGEPIRVSVPVHFENDGLSPGLKRGGVLNVIRHTVEVYAEPEHIPEQFTADLADLDFNDAVRWEDLKGTENTRPVIARNFVVATVAPPTKLAEVAAEPTAAAAPVAARCRRGSGRCVRHAAAPGADSRQSHAALGRPRQSGAGDGPEPAQHRLHGDRHHRHPPSASPHGASASRA